MDSFRIDAFTTKIGLSSGDIMGCCSLCDELPSLYAVKLICLFRSSAKDGCTRYEDFQSCYSTESMWHYRPSSERIQPLTGAPHEADFPFETDGVKWFWQSFGRVNSAILLKGRARCLSDYRRQLTSTFITESPHPHGPGLLQNSIPDLICRHL